MTAAHLDLLLTARFQTPTPLLLACPSWQTWLDEVENESWLKTFGRTRQEHHTEVADATNAVVAALDQWAVAPPDQQEAVRRKLQPTIDAQILRLLRLDATFLHSAFITQRIADARVRVRVLASAQSIPDMELEDEDENAIRRAEHEEALAAERADHKIERAFLAALGEALTLGPGSGRRRPPKARAHIEHVRDLYDYLLPKYRDIAAELKVASAKEREQIAKRAISEGRFGGAVHELAANPRKFAMAARLEVADVVAVDVDGGIDEQAVLAMLKRRGHLGAKKP